MSDTPKRIQLKRTRGWRMPPNTVVVARPGPLGNPLTIKNAIEAGYARKDDPEGARRFVAECFRDWLLQTPGEREWWSGPESDKRRKIICERIPDLRGKNLACWCPVGSPCHADVLLDIANRDETP